MKGGDVIIVQALKALHAAGALASHIIVVMTGDEEAGGDRWRSRAPRCRRRPTAPTSRLASRTATATRARRDRRRGTTAWKLTVKGLPAHSSQIFQPEIGAGSIFEAARILNTFREKLSAEPFLTFNPALILGGTSAEFDAAQARGTAFGKTT